MFSLTGFRETDSARFNSRNKHYQNSVALFLGHAPLTTGIHQADDATIITMLREPISRVKSFCQHVYEGKSDYLLNDFPPEQFNLSRFLASGDLQLSNLQTRLLIGDHNIDSLSEAEIIEKVLDNLFHKVAHYGLQEYFDESLILFKSELNWKLPVYLSKNRKNPEKSLSFSEQDLKKIADMNTLDIAIYQKAKDRFMARITAENFPHAELKKLKRFNRYGYPVIYMQYKMMNQIMKYSGLVKRYIKANKN